MAYSQKIELSQYTIDLTQRILGGHELKYDAEFHVALLLELFQHGQDVSAFCLAAEIGRNTFYEWTRKHPEFGKAFQIANEMAFQYWLVQGQTGISDPTFNTQLWSKIMGSRFRFTDSRKIKVSKLKEAKTPKEQLDVLAEEMSDGDLTVPEANQVTKFIEACIKVEEHTEMAKDINEIKEMLGNK